MHYNKIKLDNGLVIIHKQIKSEVSHCGFVIDAGSNDENKDEKGVAHLIEHCIFKGTKTRKTSHILNRLDSVGGELNAYTTKEETCVYASFLNQYADRAVELLFDIISNSVFAQDNIDKEKNVVIDEINSYKDSISDMIFDDIEELIFKGHPAQNPILGSVQNVKSLSRENILSFVAKHYISNNMVFSFVGDISFERVLKIVAKYNFIKNGKRQKSIRKIEKLIPQKIVENKDCNQTHLVLANRCYDVFDDNIDAMVLLNNIIGGPAMNSKLNINIREKFGITYNIESFYNAYSDTGIFGIYAGMEDRNVDKVIHLIYKEFASIKNNFTNIKLEKAKKQFIGQMALSRESNVSAMLGMGKSILLYKRVDSISQMTDRINKISLEQIQNIAQEILDKNSFTTIIYREKQ